VPPKIILASSSLTRKELLQKLGLKFEPIPSFTDEIPLRDELTDDFASGTPTEKAMNVSRNLVDDSVHIGADAIIVITGEILGKPKDDEEAIIMLQKISGKEIRLITGFRL
jgi:nucleoside triphosphate pyrophosphatase